MDCAMDGLYSDCHLWVASRADNLVVIGLSRYGLEEIGAPDYVELPRPGAGLIRNEAFAIIETVKAAVELIAPVSGTVTRSNRMVVENPGLLMEAPYNEGWLVEARLEDPDELRRLMPPEIYLSLIEDARSRLLGDGRDAEGSNK